MLIPALFTRMSSRPKRSATAWTIPATDASRLTSTSTASA
jgi:hypothetical protein